MNTRNIIYFFSGILFAILIEAIVFFIILYDSFPGHVKVEKNDWKDDWLKNVNTADSTKIEFYSDRMYNSTNRYVIKNFDNAPAVVKIIISACDTSKYRRDKEYLSWVFLWNTKYNHEWRVENVDQKYVNDIASLFGLTFIGNDKYGRVLLNNIYLYPTLQKRHPAPSRIKILSKSGRTTYLSADYEKGLDFFLWKDLQDYTKLLSEKNDHRGRYVLLNGSNKKELVTIEWFGEGYKIKLPKAEDKLKK